MTGEHLHLCVHGPSRVIDLSLRNNKEQLNHSTFAYRNNRKNGQISTTTVDDSNSLIERSIETKVINPSDNIDNIRNKQTPQLNYPRDFIQHNSPVKSPDLQDVCASEQLFKQSCTLSK